MEKYLTKENINNYTSNFYYNYFERGDHRCEHLDFYTDIKEDLNVRYQFYNFPDISEKIVRALCYIYNRKKNRPAYFNEDLCWYLYYWLGDKIYPLVKNKTIFSNIIRVIYEELYTNIPELFTVCKLVHSPIDQVRFNHNKILFDYSKDYKNIEMDTSNAKNTCDKDYKDYINKYISVYKEAYSDCYSGKGNNFDCAYFSELFDRNQFSTLSSFSCKQHDNNGVLLENQKAHEHPEPEPVHLYPQARVALPSTQQIVVQDAYLGMNHISDSSENPGTNENFPIEDTTKGSSSKTIAGSIVPVLGVSSFSLLLYKVTENITEIHIIMIYPYFHYF
ncbi:hypothetical protein PVMG_05645 [Plasmodium vivax Mauritania I]|uniref:Variable surface protein n=1 Tax=Plasmodium vivax Mauritania I TaxID=1035515 RepID=A0A0J9TIT0_PLAVI|nr:hypothetical protein PVMG_05645 [Plasmodium vivax Mauritania I]